MSIAVEIPMRLPSTSNLREHWAVKARRVKAQRAATLLTLKSRAPFLLTASSVTLTRVAPRQLDDDNLRGALKAVRDAVAEFLHVDDGDPRVAWVYAQAKGKPERVVVEFQ